MKKMVFVLIATVLLPGIFSPAAEVAPATDRAAIERAVIGSYDRMIATAEALNVDELYRSVAETDKGALVINGRLLLRREDALQTTRDNFRGIQAVKYEVRDRLVTVLSPTVALLVTTGTSHVETNDGRRFSRPFAHSVVFILQDGAWRVIHSHQSSPPAT